MGSKYIIDGMTLDVYCEKHELNFRTQSNRVRDYIKKYPELSEQDAIKLAISKCGVHPGTKFMYGNISLIEWCRRNAKSYDCMISRVERIKASFPNISDNEATRISIEDYSDKGAKYFYDGMPLVDYCRLHPDYLYNSVLSYIKRKKEKNSNLTDQEIIDFYFETEHPPHNYHFIDGVPLIEYCDNHDIAYTSIIQALHRMRKDKRYKNLSEQERLEIAKEKALIDLQKRTERNNYILKLIIKMLYICKRDSLVFPIQYCLFGIFMINLLKIL